MSLELKVPPIGESIREATIGVWKKAEGDWIAADEAVVEVESEKATMEVPAPGAGLLKKILKKQGEVVGIGEVIAEIDNSATKPDAAKGAAGKAAGGAPAPSGNGKAPSPSQAAPQGNQGNGDGSVRAAPSARRLMEEAGLPPGAVQGSGRGGRIAGGDVLKALEPKASGAAPVPAGSSSASPSMSVEALHEALTPGRRERVVPMTPLRQTVARRLVQAQSTAAILTTFNEVDMSAVMSLRERYQDRFLKQHGVKLGFMSFFVKAAIEALKAFPGVNAEIRGTDIIYKDHYDIGVAVGGGKGLVVPVVREADRMGFAEVEKKIGELAVLARDNKLQMKDLEGGTFTISNGGIYGSMLSTPILNPPQSGILGLHNIQKRAVVVNDAIVIRPMMYLALSYDHRLVDGREAVQFLVRVKECVEDPERILLEI